MCSCFANYLVDLGVCGPLDPRGARPKKVFHHVGCKPLKYYNLSRADFGGTRDAHERIGGTMSVFFNVFAQNPGNDGWNT